MVRDIAILHRYLRWIGGDLGIARPEYPLRLQGRRLLDLAACQRSRLIGEQVVVVHRLETIAIDGVRADTLTPDSLYPLLCGKSAVGQGDPAVRKRHQRCGPEADIVPVSPDNGSRSAVAVGRNRDLELFRPRRDIEDIEVANPVWMGWIV